MLVPSDPTLTIRRPMHPVATPPPSKAAPGPIAAMILAAGRGQRMRPLTDVTPKPLLPVRGQPLMQWSMQALGRGGYTRLVINTAWLGEQIVGAFSGQAGADIQWSHEGLDFGYALETAGGIARALPALGEVFWVLAGDVYMPDFVFEQSSVERFAASDKLAHLWLVPNPTHKPDGDFGVSTDGLALNDAANRYTFSTVALYRRALFEPPWCVIPAGNPQGTATPLSPLLRAATSAGKVSAELYLGLWVDVGTPQRLAELNP